MNHWLSSIAFLLGGMTLKWVLDLFFLRHAYRDNEHKLNVREAEFTALKHEHSQALTDLKNKLTELDATSKAKALAEGNLAKLNSNLVSLRTHVLRTEEELTASRHRDSDLTERIATRDRELQSAAARLESLQSESQEHASTTESQRLRLAEVAAASATHADAAAGLGTQLADSLREADAHTSRIKELEGALDAQHSVTATLEAAVRSRDAQIADCQSRFAALEAERQSVATSLKVADSELGIARTELADQAKRLEDATQLSTSREVELRSLRTQLDGVAKARAGAESLVSRHAARIQALDAERAELLTEVESARADAAPIRLQSESGPAGVGPAPDLAPDPAWIHRIRDLEAELEAVSGSHAQLETELARERERSAGLEDKLRTAMEAPPEALASPTKGAANDAALLAEIDELNRERNALAAELAGLKAANPPGAGGVSRKKRSRAAEVDLFEAPAGVSADSSRDTVLSPADGPTPGEGVTEFSAKCPQHLSDVKGIGSAFEQRLYAAGVGSYWELAQLSDRALAEVLELDERQREHFDFFATRADAGRLAEETRSVGRKWTGEQPDDLEPLEGIGAVVEKRLYDAGICTYAALAAASVELLAEICPAAKFRGANYARWIEQARQRIAEEEN